MAEQTTVKAGWFAKSLAGHDRGRWYVIVEVRESGIYVADGRLRTAEKPKRKNPKHLQICTTDACGLLKQNGETAKADSAAVQSGNAKCLLQNEQIKYVLHRFCSTENELRNAELEDEHVKG